MKKTRKGGESKNKSRNHGLTISRSSRSKSKKKQIISNNTTIKLDKEGIYTVSISLRSLINLNDESERTIKLSMNKDMYNPLFKTIYIRTSNNQTSNYNVSTNTLYLDRNNNGNILEYVTILYPGNYRINIRSDYPEIIADDIEVKLVSTRLNSLTRSNKRPINTSRNPTQQNINMFRRQILGPKNSKN
jgi:sucrose-6-phosphate hydrolase SacC (GH32 family)